MLDFITTFVTDPANVPLAGWIGAAAAVVAALVGVIALFRRSRAGNTTVKAERGSVAGVNVRARDISLGTGSTRED